MTFETLTNDDASAFLKLVPALGQAARRVEADLVYSLLLENSGDGPTMADNQTLFHSTHGNVTDPGLFDADLLSAGRVLLRRQVALGGGLLSLVPRYLIVAPEYETPAERLIAAGTRVRTGSVEAGVDSATPEWISRLELVVEPRLTDAAAYLATSAMQMDHIEMATLVENADGPVIVSDQGFIIDETRWKCRHTAGVKAIDHRGMVQMPISLS